MNRKKFFSFIILPFVGSAFFFAKKKEFTPIQTDCDNPITPPVPEGPYYKNEKLNRIDITENKKGIPIEYIFKVEDKHCKPITGAIVDIWQCDTDGHYSDFETEHTMSQTWLRGFQKTDSNGECRFTSIFPGWYDKRITHIHAKVHINGKDVLTTNFFFPKDIETEVYKHPLYPKGINPISILNDIELKVDKDTKRHDTLLMDVAKNKNGNLVAKYLIAIV
jgi:protocatechuate 3,4-dioxygenase beta subunit